MVFQALQCTSTIYSLQMYDFEKIQNNTENMRNDHTEKHGNTKTRNHNNHMFYFQRIANNLSPIRHIEQLSGIISKPYPQTVTHEIEIANNRTL